MRRIASPVKSARLSCPYLRLHGMTAVGTAAFVGLALADGNAFAVAVGLAVLVCNEISALRGAVEWKQG